MRIRFCLSSLAAVCLLTACGQAEQGAASQPQPESQTQQGQLPSGHPQLAAVSHDSVSQGALFGGVVEQVLSGGGYTYVMVRVDGQEYWAAAPMTSVTVGQKVAWETNAPMKNFHSSSLNRTFETVYFVSHFNTPGNMNHQATAAGNNPHGGMAMAGASAAAGETSGEVLEVMSGAGYSYLKVNAAGKDMWLAVPEIAVAVGNKVSWNGGSEMTNFSSRTLNRTFDSIWFIDKVQVN